MAELFRERWNAVSTDLANGVDVAKRQADGFFARNKLERLRLAQVYYSPTRAAALATASNSDILRYSSTWFTPFRNHVKHWDVSGEELKDEIRQLISAEYVAVSWLEPDPFGRSRRELTTVSPLPDRRVSYGDVYEITASGFSCGAYLRVSKSVAEPFSQLERIETMKAIELEFFANAAEDGEDEGSWQITFKKSRDPRVIEAIVEEIDQERRESTT